MINLLEQDEEIVNLIAKYYVYVRRGKSCPMQK